MKFSVKSKIILDKMGIDSEKYSIDISKHYGKDAEIIDALLLKFGTYPEELTREVFKTFIGDLDDKPLLYASFDIFNNLSMFKKGGRLNLFKSRLAEWDGPVVTLKKQDVPPSDISELLHGMSIYRGMSSAEFNCKKFGQSALAVTTKICTILTQNPLGRI